MASRQFAYKVLSLGSGCMNPSILFISIKGHVFCNTNKKKKKSFFEISTYVGLNLSLSFDYYLISTPNFNPCIAKIYLSILISLH